MSEINGLSWTVRRCYDLKTDADDLCSFCVCSLYIGIDLNIKVHDIKILSIIKSFQSLQSRFIVPWIGACCHYQSMSQSR